jgi:CubicO group peptidase (beta-lactamase class C family)
MIQNNPSILEPIRFNSEKSGSTIGSSENGFRYVSEIFDRQLQEGLHPGAQLVLLKDGCVVIDRFGGYTGRKFEHQVTADTLFPVFSITKSFLSACVFRVVEEGLVDLDTPVGYYWPEFSSQGKDDITVRQIMLHQAGLPNRRIIYQIMNISNWQKLTRDLARQKPQYAPGSKTAYHSLNFGYILAEVIRRVSGIPIDEFLEQEILSPLGFRNSSMGVSEFDKKSCALMSSGTLNYQIMALYFNAAKVRSALIPAASLNSTARELAIFFQMLLNDGEYAGKWILAQESVQLATSLGYEGYDDAFGRIIRWGYGFFLGGEHILNPELPDGMGKGSSVETFGHYGQRTSVVWGDKRTGTVMAFLCNRFLSAYDYKVRIRELSEAVWDVVDS